MTDKQTGGPAFPGLHPSAECRYQEEGMTLRDYFAAKAMQGFISCGDPCNIELDVKAAYTWADYMMKARES